MDNIIDKSETSFQLHGLSLVDANDAALIESVLKTYNSLSRCACKRFSQIGLSSMLKFHRKP